MSLVLRLVIVACIATALAAGGFFANKRYIPQAAFPAAGLKVNGRVVEPSIPAADIAEAHRDAILHQIYTLQLEVANEPRITLYQGRLEDLGATVDVDDLAERILSVGRKPDLWDRISDVQRARRGEFNLQVPVSIPVERLAELAIPLKEAVDRQPRPARLLLGTHEVVPHADGQLLDPYEAVEALYAAIGSGETTVAFKPVRVVPKASTKVASSLSTDVVAASFETRFSAGQTGRTKNIERAAGLLNGTIVMPGQEISYNHIVGARSIENGFFSAPEIYKGEMREGIGGGACQVASTLYAAAFYAGLDIVERRNHSRPSGYMPIGLDAVVSYPVLDLKIRNPFDFPLVVDAEIQPGQLRFNLRGAAKTATVDFTTAAVGRFKYKRRIRKASYLPDGEFRLKQKGKNGVSIKRMRTVRTAQGEVRVEESTDVYPPTTEVYLIAPGADPDELLPPLPGEGDGDAVPTG